jgi:hypothetical protein
VVDARVSIFLDEAIAELDVGAWGLCYAAAVLAYAAHTLALAEVTKGSATLGADGSVQVQQTGTIVSATAEGLTVAFAASTRTKSAAQEWLSQTTYGQAFAAKQRQCLSRGRLSW